MWRGFVGPVTLGGVALMAACAGVVAPSSAPSPRQALLESALRPLYPVEAGGVRYLMGEADLDGDDSPELLAWVYGPLICETGGCDLLIFTPSSDGLRKVGDVSVSRLPLEVAATRTHGWRDLIVAVGGGGGPSGRVRLEFDGSHYPTNASTAPQVGDEVEGEVLIPDFRSFDDGTLLPAGEPSPGNH